MYIAYFVKICCVIYLRRYYMATAIILLAEFIFFVVMSFLFEYHWRNDDFEKKTAIMIRIWYYSICAICLGVMAFSL